MDLSTLSNDQLMEMRQRAAVPPVENPLATMSDADLLAARKAKTNLAGTDVPIPQTVLEKLLGQNGPRYQTWPERLARGVGNSVVSAATYPGDVITGKAQVPGTHYLQPGTTKLSDEDLALGQSQAQSRMMDLTGIALPVNPAIRAGDKIIPGISRTSAQPRIAAPTEELLKKTGGAQIEASRNMGVDFSTDAIQSLAKSIQQGLETKGFSDEVAGETFGILKRLQKPPVAADGSERAVASFGNAQTIREALNKAAGSPDARERNAATQAIRSLDEWLSAPPASAVVAGPATEAAALYKTGRGNYAAAMRSGEITGRAELADLRAAAANSGRNIDNATRQRFVNIVADESQARGFNPAEIGAAENVVRGTPGMNTARYIAHLLGGGGGLGQAMTTGVGAGIGATAGAVVGQPFAGGAIGATIPPIIGAIAKKLSNTLTTKQVEKLDELVRSRSPLFEQSLNAAPLEATGVGRNEAIAKALMMGGNQMGNR